MRLSCIAALAGGLGIALIVPFQSVAQQHWQPAQVVLRTAPTDTLNGWTRLHDGQVQLRATGSRQQQAWPLPAVQYWRTATGTEYEATPAQLTRITNTRVLRKLVAGPAALFADDATPRFRYLLILADSGYALPANNYLQQLSLALPGCPVTSPDSLAAAMQRLRYNARTLAPLVVRYNRCRMPGASARLHAARSGARLQLGAWAGIASQHLRFQYAGQLQDLPFADRIRPTAGLLARFTFNEQFYLQPEISYTTWQGEGSVNIPTGTTVFTSTTNASLQHKLVTGNLLARLHLGPPVGHLLRPVLLGGLSGGYALSSQLTISNTSRYADGRVFQDDEQASIRPVATGYVLGAGTEFPLLRHRPTLEVRYQTLTASSRGVVTRPIQAQILSVLAGWYL